MISDEKLIKGCIDGKRRAHSLLYKKYARIMMGICMRYCKNKQEAEDVLQEGFIKVFTKINQFRMEGSFEGWMKRIIINTAINHYHYQSKQAEVNDTKDVEEYENQVETDDVDVSLNNTGMSHEQLLAVIRQLPSGYKMVFNLYAIEGYNHSEIAEILNISINTSKTQLMKARRSIIKKIEEYQTKHTT